MRALDVVPGTVAAGGVSTDQVRNLGELREDMLE